MKKGEKKNLMIVFGSTLSIFGSLFSISFYLNSNLVGMIFSGFLGFIGVILLAIAFGE